MSSTHTHSCLCFTRCGPLAPCTSTGCSQRCPSHCPPAAALQPHLNQRESSDISTALDIWTDRKSSMQWCINGSLTGDAQWTDGVFVECEALLQSMGPHVLVEYITAGEVQHAAVILILRNKPADTERERHIQSNQQWFDTRYHIWYVYQWVQ